MSSSQHTYFRPTSIQQRRLLFEVWEQTGSIDDACQQARVSRATFYVWKKRFDVGGYEALEASPVYGPKNPHRTPDEIADLVILLKKAHPAWGKRQIANEIKSQSGKTISPNTVRRILNTAGMWPAAD